MKRYTFVFLVLLSFSCKSTKKNLVESNRVDQDIISVTTEEITTDLGNVTKKTIITETVTKKYEVVDGTDIVKPSTVTTITTEVEEKENKNQSIKKAIEEDNISLNSFDSLYLDKETEGMEVVEEIVSGVTGAFIGDIAKYIIGAIFFVILLILLSKLFKERKQVH